MANVLSREKQLLVLNALVEGVGIRATERLTGVSRETVLSLLVRVGHGCASLLDEKMVGLSSTRLELDEIWSFVHCKQKHITGRHDPLKVGDTWVFTAIDPDSKLMPVFLIGKRTEENTVAFLNDLAWRFTNRIQVSTDGFPSYLSAVPDAFKAKGVDYATIVKEYEAEPAGAGRYSPPKVTAMYKTPVCGMPEETLVSTSGAERSNLTIRMQMRRFTRLTNAHSKKLENHGCAVALHLAWYNFVRVHMSIRVTPCMAAGIESRVWEMGELLDAALERHEASKGAS